jgi:hypothetical protein
MPEPKISKFRRRLKVFPVESLASKTLRGKLLTTKLSTDKVVGADVINTFINIDHKLVQGDMRISWGNHTA